MRETRTSGSEGGGTKSIASPYPYNSCRRYASKRLVQPFHNLSARSLSQTAHLEFCHHDCA
jgi:hypothetical protein